jgi:starvation-inducible DNA-binding protein
MDTLVEQMNTILSESLVLSLKAQGFHWNVEDPMFPMYHEFFGEYYGDIYGEVDKIAEQIRALDAYPVTTYGKMLTMSAVKEIEGPLPATSMVRELAADNEKLSASWNRAFNLATSADQQGLADYVAGRIDAHRKHAWMFRAMLKKSGQTSESVEHQQPHTYEIVFNK